MRASLVILLAVGAALPPPSKAGDDVEICSVFKEIAARLNAEAPTMTDAITRLDGMAVICAFKRVAQKDFVNVPVSAFRQGWQARKQAQWDAIVCRNASWREAIASGWTVTDTMTFQDGSQYELRTAACP
jgi:hypothetical protein